MRFSQPSSIRFLNRLRVLDLVRHHEGLSRADLSKELDLNKPSCSEIVHELVELGLISEGKKEKTASGRRPTPLTLDTSKKRVLGISIGEKVCALSVGDLKGNVGFMQMPTPTEKDPASLVAQLASSLKHMLGQKTKAEDLVGCVATIEGELSQDAKAVIHKKEWGWTNVPLAALLAHALSCPCSLSDPTEAMVEAEYSLSDTAPKGNFLYVRWDEHIGAVAFRDGQLESAGIGHVKIVQDGDCVCGGKGCLETVAAGWALEKMFGSSLRSLCQNPPKDFMKAVDGAAIALGMVIAQAVSVTNLSTILLAGTIPALLPQLKDRVQLAMDESLSPIWRGSKVSISEFGEKARRLAPVATALERYVFQSRMLARYN